MTQSLWELTRLFLKLGTVSFGGPAAHLALIEDEAVRRRGWLSRDQLLDIWAATNLIPGPNALKVATYIGYRRAGLAGSVLAAVSFTLPAALLTILLAWIYQAYREVPQAKSFLHGIQPAALAIIAVAAYRLGKTAFKDWRTGLVGLSAVAAAWVLSAAAPSWARWRDVVILLAAGALGAVFLRLTERRWAAIPPAAPLGAWVVWIAAGSGVRASASAAAAVAAAAAVTVPVWKLALFFLEVGAVLYGTGYVLPVYLQGGLVDQYGWLTQQELNDTIAAGQVTPGPLITSATFAGYLLSGPGGAVAATVAIILPGFLLVVLLSRWLERLRAWSWSARFLDAVNAAAIGLIVWLIRTMALSSLVDWQSWLIAALVALAILLWKAPLAFLVLGGGLAGLLLS